MITMSKVGEDQKITGLCRLCLKTSGELVNIFSDNNAMENNKESISHLLYKLFFIKVDKTPFLPQQICEYCMTQTEHFNEFTINVRKCEAKLQNLIATKALNGASKISEIIKPRSPEKPQPAKEASNVNEDCIVTDIDPNQDYESSDDDFSMDSDNESSILNNNNEVVMRSQLHKSVPSAIPEVKKLKIKLNPPSAIPPQSPFNIEEQLCVFCDRPFLNQKERKEHEESVHDIIAPFNCNFCAFKTNTKQFVIQHIKEVHQQDKPYICVLCMKGFTRRTDLKKHAYFHTGVKPFKCSICSKTFSRNTNLTKHMKTHSNSNAVKSYLSHSCDKCPRNFVTHIELLRHQKSHEKTNEIATNPPSMSQSPQIIKTFHRTDYNGQKPIPVQMPSSQQIICIKCNSSFIPKSASSTCCDASARLYQVIYWTRILQ
ncbi:hypothetical protein ACFFRR_005232 [Megaselia abdita]